MDQQREATQLLEAFLAKGDKLATKWASMPGRELRGFDTSKHVNFLEGIEDPEKRAMIAHLLENTHRWMRGLEESTRTMQVGSFEKFVSSEAPLAA